MPSDALYAIGSIPRRPRDALRLSQKTCLRSAYRIFGLKRDMFLERATAGFARGRVVLAMLNPSRDISVLAGVSRVFYLFLRGKTFVFPVIGA